MQGSLISKDKMYRYNIDNLIMCIGLSSVGIYINGAAALMQIAVCIFTAVICELITFHGILKRKTLPQLSAVTTGFIIALLLPASAPLYVGALASAFAVIATAFPFGDFRNTPFLPSAAGFCFAAICFPDAVFTYPSITDTSFTAFISGDFFTAGTSLGEMLSSGYGPALNIFGLSDLLSGRLPGATGSVSLMAFIGAAGYLLVRHAERLIPSFGFILSAGLFAFLFPRINSGRVTSLVLELCAGSLLFVALLVINNPVTAPKQKLHAFVYGLVAGIITMLLRYFISAHDSCVFTVLIMNMIYSPLISRSGDKKRKEGDADVKSKKAVG